MSIVINGIGMPVDCTRCPCSDDETRFCRAANKYIPMLGKPKFCPLAEIIMCKDCVNYLDERCAVANHHVAGFSCCLDVFGAERKGEQP